MTTPSSYTSTYNDDYRDRTRFISPNSVQPMYHYKSDYDKSHWGPATATGVTSASQYGAYSQTANTRTSAATTISTPYVSAPSASASASASATASASSSTRFHATVRSNQEMFPKAVPGGKDLWNGQPCPSHGGIVALTCNSSRSNIAYEPNSSVGYSADYSNSTQSGNGQLDVSNRPKYHIPGYSGFVRGDRFRFGATYGKASRMALDVPVDTPLEP